MSTTKKDREMEYKQEVDCRLSEHEIYNCATCNVLVCDDGCPHDHREYWADKVTLELLPDNFLYMFEKLCERAEHHFRKFESKKDKMYLETRDFLLIEELRPKVKALIDTYGAFRAEHYYEWSERILEKKRLYFA